MDGRDYVFFWKPNMPNGYLCQWYRSHFVVDDINFANAEQYMMYKKAELFNDRGMMEVIANMYDSHPAECKRAGRRVSNFDEDVWNAKALAIVATGNYHKFAQDDTLREFLLATNGKTIVEASPHDRIWGIGFKDADAMRNLNRWGSNGLGKALMMARDKIINSG